MSKHVYTLSYDLTDAARVDRIKVWGESDKTVELTLQHGETYYTFAAELLGLERRYKLIGEFDGMLDAGGVLKVARDELTLLDELFSDLKCDADAADLLSDLYAEDGGYLTRAVRRYVQSVDIPQYAEDLGSGLTWAYAVANHGPCHDELALRLQKRIEDKGPLSAISAKHNQKKADALARRKAEEDARKEADSQRREAERAERVEWIEAHGSNRLKRSLAEGIHHEAVYRDERLALERPGWRWAVEVPGEDDDPRNVPEEAFELLDQARESDPEASLRFWTVEAIDVDHDWYDSPGGSPYVWTGYVAMAEFLGRLIVFGGPEE